jgi:hypothetical protein
MATQLALRRGARTPSRSLSEHKSSTKTAYSLRAALDGDAAGAASRRTHAVAIAVRTQILD